MNSLQGKVKFYNSEKGYGFIQPSDGSGDVFVHVSALQDSNIETLHKDDAVTFEKADGRNDRLKAVNLKITS